MSTKAVEGICDGTRWIMCRDQMPEPDRLVLVSDGTRVRMMAWASNPYARRPKPRWEQPMGNLPRWSPTHWMPLPKPPTLPDR